MKAITITGTDHGPSSTEGIVIVKNEFDTYCFRVGDEKTYEQVNFNKMCPPEIELRDDLKIITSIQFVRRDNPTTGKYFFLVVEPKNPNEEGMVVLLNNAHILKGISSNYKILIEINTSYLILLLRKHRVRFKIGEEVWIIRNSLVSRES